MAYTHYFRHTTVTHETWNLILTDCRKLYDNKPDDLEIGDWEGAGEPAFNHSEISFNGCGDDAHESFHLEKNGHRSFAFCKTACKPYDLMVCACLLVYKYHSPETIKISSDGDKEDWQPAMDFVSKVLGVDFLIKLELDGRIFNGN